LGGALLSGSRVALDPCLALFGRFVSVGAMLLEAARPRPRLFDLAVLVGAGHRLGSQLSRAVGLLTVLVLMVGLVLDHPRIAALIGGMSAFVLPVALGPSGPEAQRSAPPDQVGSPKV